MSLVRPLVAVARRLDAVFLILLLAVYVLAAVLPAPPAVISPVSGVRTSQLVLAVLLFVAGLRMAVPTDRADLVRSGTLIGAGVIGRLLPLTGVLAGLAVLSAGGASAPAIDIAVGLALVAAMPTANTSTAWTRRSSGDLAVCVGVVVGTTMLSPLVISAAMAVIDDSTGQSSAGGVTFRAVALGVVAWVVLPIVLGIGAGRAGGLSSGKPLSGLGSSSTLAALLLLNYINASQSLPSVLERGGAATLAWAACGAVALVPLCYGVGAATARLRGAPPAQAVALAYAVGMSNTGLAGTLAAAAFPGRPATLYPIVVCTLLQHIVAALVHERVRAVADGLTPRAAAPAPRGTSHAVRPNAPRR